MKNLTVFKKITAVCVLACMTAAVITGCGCKKRDSDEDAIREAMKVFETGEISRPAQLDATLIDGSQSVEPVNDIAVLSFESPEEIKKLDIVKRKAFGKDGSIPMPQITEFEIYIQTDCNVDDTGWHYTETWDTYNWDGKTEWGEKQGSYEGFDNRPYEAQTWLSGENTVPYSGEYEVSCLDYIENDNSCFLDSVLKIADDVSGGTSYHYDLSNHTVLYRHRFVIKYTESGEHKVIISDWSDPAWLVPKALGTDV